MSCSKLKILLYVTLSLMFLFTPFSLKVFKIHDAYAMGKWFSQNRSSTGSTSHITYNDPKQKSPDSELNHETPDSTRTPVAPVPEPATWLLVGGGAAALAAYKKKFKKK